MTTVKAPAHLPRRSARPWPRLARSLEIIQAADGIIIDGGPQRVRLRSARSSLLHRLVSMLDGEHSPESICRQLAITREQLDRVIGTLREEGVLEFAPDDGAHWPVPGHVAAYLARAGRPAEDYSCVEDLLAALAEAVVLLVAAPSWASCMAADLTETGIGQVVVLDSGSEADLVTVAHARRAVIAAWDNPEDPAAFDIFITACAGMGVPVLRFTAGADGAEIGPLFFDGHTPCTACFRAGRGPALAPGGTGTVRDGAETSMACGLAVNEILAIATGLAPALAPGRLLRLAYSDLAITTFCVSPDPTCPSCGAPPDDAAALVQTYEYSTALRPATLAWSVPATPAQRKLAVPLQLQRTSYPWAPRQQLPAAGFPVTDERDLGPAARIGSLLRAVAGTRAEQVAGFQSRWAPTGGNLASVELFAITGTPIFDLPGSVFKYDDLEHAIISARRDPDAHPHADPGPGSASLRDLLASTDLPGEPPDLLLVMVAALGRLGEKYGEFCLRLAHLDAGCAALQLAIVAPELRLTGDFAASWTPEIAAALELDPGTELVTAVAGITIQGGHRWA